MVLLMVIWLISDAPADHAGTNAVEVVMGG